MVNTQIFSTEVFFADTCW